MDVKLHLLSIKKIVNFFFFLFLSKEFKNYLIALAKFPSFFTAQ